jgi:hypothetical protein
LTRRDIVDSLSAENVDWAGRLTQPDFLSRLFDLHALPSRDPRYSNMYGDAWQHTVNNDDWERDWPFYDDRLNLLHGDDETFLRFLCEILHPVVRSDRNEVDRLKQAFNQLLRPDGFEIVERTQISGRPVFAGREILEVGPPGVQQAKSAFEAADLSYVMRQITRMESSVNQDPDLAIGTAKELVESCCKTILTERGVVVESAWDLAQLVKRTSKELALTPADIDHGAKAADTIKRLLSNLATITQGIAELRNQYGTGHGRSGKAKGLTPRHAKLAVGAASTLAVFLIETHQERA